ncbi:hypothetical protein D3C80_1435040 [compost metagenome]
MRLEVREINFIRERNIIERFKILWQLTVRNSRHKYDIREIAGSNSHLQGFIVIRYRLEDQVHARIFILEALLIIYIFLVDHICPIRQENNLALNIGCSFCTLISLRIGCSCVVGCSRLIAVLCVSAATSS